MLHHNAVRKAFHRLLKSVGLRRVRFHDLRHTFASLLLQQGESPVYVKEQMGHSSIQVTVDEYGHLIPGGNRQAVDRRDGALGTTVSPAQSATQPQPTDEWAASLRREGIEITEDDDDENGVSDGFRTRIVLWRTYATEATPSMLEERALLNKARLVGLFRDQRQVSPIPTFPQSVPPNVPLPAPPGRSVATVVLHARRGYLPRRKIRST